MSETERASAAAPASSPAPGEVKIRPAREGESKAVRALIGLFPQKLVQSPLPKLKYFMVAEVDGRLVGCCALDIFSRRMAEIRSLSVHPDFQGRGIATQLIEACVRYAKRRRIRELMTITSSLSLFEKCGFSPFKSERLALIRQLEAPPPDPLQPPPVRPATEDDGPGAESA
ncbi:MAG: GNAT family N-acetyltransferase [Planctomycetota bacterium]|nr:GNAT family N-acetyltransferase [Planctomycetota bacterium]